MNNRTFSKVFNKQVDIQSSTHQYQFQSSVNSQKIPHGNQEKIRKSVTLMNFILTTIMKKQVEIKLLMDKIIMLIYNQIQPELKVKLPFKHNLLHIMNLEPVQRTLILSLFTLGEDHMTFEDQLQLQLGCTDNQIFFNTHGAVLCGLRACESSTVNEWTQGCHTKTTTANSLTNRPRLLIPVKFYISLVSLAGH